MANHESQFAKAARSQRRRAATRTPRRRRWPTAPALLGQPWSLSAADPIRFTGLAPGARLEDGQPRPAFFAKMANSAVGRPARPPRFWPARRTAVRRREESPRWPTARDSLAKMANLPAAPWAPGLRAPRNLRSLDCNAHVIPNPKMANPRRAILEKPDAVPGPRYGKGPETIGSDVKTANSASKPSACRQPPPHERQAVTLMQLTLPQTINAHNTRHARTPLSRVR